MTSRRGIFSSLDIFRRRSKFAIQRRQAPKIEMLVLQNKKPPSSLSTEQGQIGGWEFAMLSFPR
jgi:hypothetical protein